METPCGGTIFAVLLRRFPQKPRVSFFLLTSDFCLLIMGVTGFDSKMSRHGSMPSLAAKLVNLNCKKVIGENNYAFAA